MVTYVPGTQERDLTKIVMSLQQVGPRLDTAVSDIASRVVGPGSATNNGFAVYDGTTGKLIKDHAATIALASEVSGTLPVANGGTGDTGTAWTSYTPTVTASSGTFTTVSATGRWKSIGKTVFVKIAITITTVGTASGIVAATLPNTSADAYNFSGNSGSGFQLTVNTVSNQAYFTKYDGTSVISAGATLYGSGVYEST